MRYFLYFLLSQISYSLYCQSLCERPIEIDYKSIMCNLRLSNDTLETPITSTSKYRYKLKDCFGTMYFEYYENDVKLVQGEYYGNKKKYKIVGRTTDPVYGTISKRRRKIYFYKPIRYGTWYFFYKDGEIQNTVIYNKVKM